MNRIVLASLSIALLCSTSVFAADAQPAPNLDGFSEFNDNSSRHVDYEIWSDLLHDVVLNVPPMDRQPERTRTRNTGTRASTANETRYRYEGNRVVYHLMSDEYKEAVTFYREDLEALPSQIDFSALSSNEQLAYWFNLHNVAIIEQIMLDYPLTRINELDANGTNQNVFEAKILTVAGVPLSLNDIRLRIVYAQWDDPRVMYGFFNGSIGGPEIARNAFDGTRVWGQLDANAREFVNSLRGIEVARSELRVSHLYEEARHFFPNFDTDLRTHLASFANPETSLQLTGNRPVRASINEWHIADLINGSRRCTGTAGASTLISSVPEGSRNPSGASSALGCASMPTNGLIMMNAVFDRRIELMEEGRFGEVYTIDVPTDENGNEIRLRPASPPSSDDSE
jgi:hypothetical protein